MLHRPVIAVALICLFLTATFAFAWWRTAGLEEMEAITERIATATARSDREALAAEPVLHDRAGTVDFLVRHSPDLANGFRATVSRNGANGYSLMSPGVVTHVGHIACASGTLHLGFRYDRESGRVEFVTAAFGTAIRTAAVQP